MNQNSQLIIAFILSFFFFEEKKKLILSKPTYRMNLENFQIFLSCALTKLTQS
jgi:hypothetical protein